MKIKTYIFNNNLSKTLTVYEDKNLIYSLLFYFKLLSLLLSLSEKILNLLPNKSLQFCETFYIKGNQMDKKKFNAIYNITVHLIKTKK